MKKKPFKKVIVAATGSVGAAVVPQIILYARLNYANEVHLIVSESALKFITPYAAKLYSGNNLLDDAFTSTDEHLVPHIQIFEDADMMLASRHR